MQNPSAIEFNSVNVKEECVSSTTSCFPGNLEKCGLPWQPIFQKGSAPLPSLSQGQHSLLTCIFSFSLITRVFHWALNISSYNLFEKSLLTPSSHQLLSHPSAPLYSKSQRFDWTSLSTLSQTTLIFFHPHHAHQTTLFKDLQPHWTPWLVLCPHPTRSLTGFWPSCPHSSLWIILPLSTHGFS